MYLKSISISNFKNIGEAQLEFSKKFNSISGNNGQGKTNLLDAIFYLSMTKSFFSSSDSYTIKEGADFFALNASYMMDDGTQESISIGLSNNKSAIGKDKIVKRNNKRYTKLADHIGFAPVVMVSPTDTILINGSSEERRRFLNMILSQIDREYLRLLQKYNQLLVSRNGLLKNSYIYHDLLEVIDVQMEQCASYIHDKRAQLILLLSGFLDKYYSKLSGGGEGVSINYISDLNEKDLITIFKENLERDRFLKYTSKGVHRDNIEFTINGLPLSKCGSQGQQKSFLIALKLAQFAIVKEKRGFAPILLLDDLFDKLDMNRVNYLLELVSGDFFGQIFITDSNKVRLDSIVERLSADCKTFNVVNGSYL